MISKTINRNAVFFWVTMLGIAIALLVFYPNAPALSYRAKELALAALSILAFGIGVRKFFGRSYSVSRCIATDWCMLGIMFAAWAAWVHAPSLNAWHGSPLFFGVNMWLCILLTVIYFLVSRLIDSDKRLAQFELALGATVGVGIFVSAVTFFIKKDFFSALFGASRSPLDPALPALGLSCVAFFVLALGWLMHKESTRFRQVAGAVGVILALGVMYAVNFVPLNILCVLASLVMFAGGMFFYRQTVGKRAYIALATAAVAAVSLGAGFITSVPAAFDSEPFLSSSASWAIVRHSQTTWDSIIFGRGFVSFANDFLLFRPRVFTIGQGAQDVLFSQPSSTVLEVYHDGGILLLVACLAWIVLVYKGILNVLGGRRVKRSLAEERREFSYAVLFVVWSVVSVASFFIHFGFGLWVMWWCLGAVLVAPLCHAASMRIRQAPSVSRWQSAVRAFAFGSCGLGLIVMALFEVGVFNAEAEFRRGITSTSTEASIRHLENAVAKVGQNALFERVLAQAYFGQAKQFSYATSSTTVVATRAAKAISAVRRATEDDPKSAATWASAAQIYAAFAFSYPEARVAALHAVHEAEALDPKNPELALLEGDIYARYFPDTAKAKLAYERAYTLWPYRGDAYARLGDISLQEGATSTAIQWYAQGLPYAINDARYLFRYGVVLYNSSNKPNTALIEELWLSSLELEPNFLEPAYGLAKMYERSGEVAKALSWYRYVAEQAPSSTAVKQKIDELQKKHP